MHSYRLTLVPALLCAGLFILPAAFATRAMAASGPPTQVAKAPETPSPKAADSVPTKPVILTIPAAKGLAVAQLAYPVSAGASAEALFEAADDCAHYCDWDNSLRYLQQVVSVYPKSKEAGLAAALLAEEYAASARTEQADAFEAQVAERVDPEVQAFSAMVRVAFPAQRASQFALYERTLSDYAHAWKGTLSGGRAALALGDCYRFNLEDYPKAIATYQAVAKDYRGTLAGQEALVSLAETLDWSVPSHPEESRATFEQALTTVSHPGLQVRCLVGLSDLLLRVNVETQAMQILTLVISNYPTHPAVSHAYALRSTAAEQQGNWELAAADARAFLAHPILGSYNVARSHSVLARDAFQKGDVAGAEAEFATLAALVEKDVPTAEFRGEAQAGLGACAIEQGDLRSALALYQKAADVEVSAAKKASYLFQAVDLAGQLADKASRARIIDRMAAEVPGSHLTSQLVGRELLPARALGG